MANGISLTERRLAFLERICQQDRERWRKNDQRLAMLYKAIQQSNRRADRRFEEQGRRIEEHDRKFEEQGRRSDALMHQIDVAVKMLHRYLEH